MKLALWNLLNSLSQASDLIGAVDTSITNHGKQVAYICMRLAEYLNLSPQNRRLLFYASIMHDIGINSTRDYRKLTTWDTEDTDHCRKGYQLLQPLDGILPISWIVLRHHNLWQPGINDNDAELASIIFLADRIDISLDPSRYILHQRTDLLRKVEQYAYRFNPLVAMRL